MRRSVPAPTTASSPSPERKEHMRELEMDLLMAVRSVNKARAALDAVASMDQTLHQAITIAIAANAHVPMAIN
uniref:Uncharacterized protein n=1 Tax=Leersia perrieri TaxID=77586 RepID=A0A0D9VVC6_9ORYZ